MAFRDIIQDHFDATDQANFNNGVALIMAVLNGRTRNLSEDENRTYGFIKEKNKLVVNKVEQFRDTQPALSCPDVDWAEFKADKFDRVFLETGAMQLMAIAKQMLETKRLHDYDNYQSALVDKRYTIYKDRASGTGSGFDTKAEELKSIYKRKKRRLQQDTSY